MTAIIDIAVRHVLDGRGNRMIEVDDRLGDGSPARAAVAVPIA